MFPVIEDILRKQAAQIIWKEIEGLLDIPTKGSLKSPERFKRNIFREQMIREIKSEF